MGGAGLEVFQGVELQAMRLDGDLVRFGPANRDRYLPVDEPETIRMRAAAIAPDVPAGFVVAQATAAWVYDGLCPGTVLHVVARRRRRPDRGRPDLRVRYARLDDTDMTIIEDLPITDPARTLLDLAKGPCCVEARLHELWRSLDREARPEVRRRIAASPRAARLDDEAAKRLRRAMG